MKKLFIYISLIVILHSLAFAQTATVISENANLRGTPTESGKVVDTLSEGNVVEVIKQRGAWFLVQSTDYVGWIHGNTIRLTTKTSKSDDEYVPPTPRRSTSREYIRGPRGGCYYINSNGNKTYVDRSLCN